MPPAERTPVHFLAGTGHEHPKAPYFKYLASRAVDNRLTAGDKGVEQSRTDAPGSVSWLVDLCVNALRSDTLPVTRQFAISSLRTLESGGPVWRDVNAALLAQTGRGIFDVEAIVDAAGNIRANPTPIANWIGHPFAVRERNFAENGKMYFVRAPNTYVDERPPHVSAAHAAKYPYCLFCIPRKNAKGLADMYNVWILIDQSWEPIKTYDHHPNPSYLSYQLKIRSDKTPNWVLTDTLKREEREERRELGKDHFITAIPAPESAPVPLRQAHPRGVKSRVAGKAAVKPKLKSTPDSGN